MQATSFRESQNTKFLALRYGGLIAAGHLLFFGAAWLFGFLDVPELRLLNVVIQVTGIYFALKQFRKTQHSLNYFRAMSVGVAASAVGTLAFVVVVFFVFQINPGLFQSIVRNLPMGQYLTVYIACVALVTEGAISGAFATYLLMNFIDTDRV